MSSHRKRHADNENSRSRSSPGKRHHHRSDSPSVRDGGGGSSAAASRGPSFPSYRDFPNLPEKIRVLCEILAASSSVEASLDDSFIRISPEDVEEVLKLSYSHPAAAVKFFRWAGPRLHHRHSPYSWNLIVDLLGKNILFDAMWDAVRSMRSEGLLSLATFASIFSSFATAARPNEAFAAFDSLHLHGVAKDTTALNSLLSALSREGLTSPAHDFLRRIALQIPPDADSFAILLEGFENEGNSRGAREVFDEMTQLIGWDPINIPAYDSFLITMLHHSSGRLDEALRWLPTMKAHGCFPGMKFICSAIDECVSIKDSRAAILLWDSFMGRKGCQPDTELYNSMISLYCHLNQIDTAYQFLDDMVLHGAFPDSKTYNLLLQSLVKNKKFKEVYPLLKEMVKNECVPSIANCESALKSLMDLNDWDTALKVWKIMIENGLGQEEIANSLIVSLRDYKRLPEACKYAEDLIDKGIKLQSSTLSKLRSSLVQVGKVPLYDNILIKWKMVHKG